ncbi:MAG TPA: hypothetical protein VNZ22_19550 [Bacillota bacterium]|nr:hypothetical protein [Bacillota bacterium]
MNTIGKNELYQNLNGFLKAKGIVLTEGSYAQGIQKSCALLTEAINLSQKGFDRAKTGMDKKLDRMRQVIHEKTAPKPPVTTAVPPSPASEGGTPAPETAAAAAPKTTTVASEGTAPPPKTSPKRPHARKKPKTPRRRS